MSFGRNTLSSLAAAVVFALAFVMATVFKWDLIVSLVLAALAGRVLHVTLPMM